MKETFSHTAKYRTVYQVIAWLLIITGIFISIVTFLTVIGVVLGLLLVGIGIFILYSLRHPTASVRETPAEGKRIEPQRTRSDPGHGERSGRSDRIDPRHQQRPRTQS